MLVSGQVRSDLLTSGHGPGESGIPVRRLLDHPGGPASRRGPSRSPPSRTAPLRRIRSCAQPPVMARQAARWAPRQMVGGYIADRATSTLVGSVFDMVDETQIREAGRRLASAAPDSRVILFGSHARGDARDRSDLDILVIKPDVENAGLEAVRLMRELRDLRLPLEVIVVSGDDVEDWGDVRGSLVHAAITEGRILAG